MLFPLFCAIFAGMNVNEIKDQKIAVLLSGGVDSSVVVYELAQLGLQPDCFYIKIGPEEDEEWDCSSEEDLEMASAVAARFDCRLEVVDCHEAYWQQVTRYTMEKVKAGFTPNPDVMCNRMIKFGAFNEKRGHTYDLIATGHYAQTEWIDGRKWLVTSPDPVKDQTDFLAQLHPYQLQKALFPIGHYQKEEVRQIAQREHLIKGFVSSEKSNIMITFGVTWAKIPARCSSLKPDGRLECTVDCGFTPSVSVTDWVLAVVLGMP